MAVIKIIIVVMNKLDRKFKIYVLDLRIECWFFPKYVDINEDNI